MVIAAQAKNPSPPQSMIRRRTRPGIAGSASRGAAGLL
jgi:hypothetical protein